MGWTGRHRGVIAGVVALAVLSGCSPASTPTPSPSVTPPSSTMQPSPSASPTEASPTPSPTATWGAEQAAAIDAVVRFAEADDQIGADPSAFTEKQMTELLKPSSGGEALESTVRWHLRLKEHRYRMAGEMEVVTTLSTKPVDDGRGIEVHVTQCQDQRQGKVVDASGAPVDGDDFQIPAYNLRQYSVRKPPGEDAFRVFGFATINGPCP